MILNIKKIYNNKLVKDSFIFVATDTINKSIPFLLLPILTKYLTPSDYGVIASFNSLFAILLVIIGLSIHGAVNINYYKLNKEQLSVFIGNIILLLLTSTIIVSVFSFIFRIQIENILKFPWQWIFVAIIISFGSFLVTVNLTLWIAEQKPKKFGLFTILDTLLKLSMSLWFIVILGYDWKGRIMAMLIGTLIMSSISILILQRRGYLKFHYNLSHIKDALNFGIPLIPHQLSIWMRNGAIIIILVNLIGQSKTGLYDVGLKIASILGFFTIALNKAYKPYLFRKLKDKPDYRTKIMIVRYTYLYFVFVLILALFLSLISPMLINAFLGEEFSEAYIFVGYLSFAFAFQGMYYMVGGYIFYEKKTKYFAYITFFVSIIHISIAYFLIKNYGALGAAQASMISFFSSFVFVWYYSNKVFKMPWGSAFFVKLELFQSDKIK